MAFGTGGAASYSGDRSPHERTRATLWMTMDFTVKPIELSKKPKNGREEHFFPLLKFPSLKETQVDFWPLSVPGEVE